MEFLVSLEQAPLPPAGIPFRAEEVGAHVVVYPVDLPAQPAEVVDDFRSDQPGGSGDQRDVFASRLQWSDSDLQYAIVRFRPSSSCTVGAQPSAERASAMSGWRWRGSSCGRGWNTSLERLPVSLSVISASSRIVNSTGLPRLTGPVSSGGD